MTLDEKDIVEEKLRSVSKPEVAEIDQSTVGTYGKSIEHSRLYEQFGIKESDKSPKIDEALAKIWEFAKSKSDGKDSDSIVFEVIRLKNDLGSAGLGEFSWTKVLNYVNVSNQMKELSNRLEEMRA